MDLKEAHDVLLREIPAGATHESCPLCVLSAGEDLTEGEPGGSMTTYTEEELRAAVDKAVAEAVAPLQTRLAEFDKANTEAAIEAKIAEATKPFEEKVAELQAELDKTTLEAQNHKTAYDELTAFLNEEAAKAERDAQVAARLESRLAQVREHANFPDDYLKANGERFAAMSDDEFAERLEEWKTLAPANGGAKPPAATAMRASAETTATGRDTTVLREVLGLRRNGVDVRGL